MNVMDSSPRAKIPSSEEAVAAPAPQGVRRRPTAGGRRGASDARAGREGRAQEGDDKQKLTSYAALAILAIIHHPATSGTAKADAPGAGLPPAEPAAAGWPRRPYLPPGLRAAGPAPPYAVRPGHRA
jgi:hypothetical protein